MERGLRTRMHWTRWIIRMLTPVHLGVTDLVDTLLVLDFCAAKAKTFQLFFFVWEAATVILLIKKYCSNSKLLFYLKKIPAELKKYFFSFFLTPSLATHQREQMQASLLS